MLSEDSPPVDIDAWVNQVKEDPVAWMQRQATHILLNAISVASLIRGKIFLKGGILMGVAYNSLRQTTDVDFSTNLNASDAVVDLIANQLSETLPRSAAQLGYADILVRLSSIKKLPRKSSFEKDTYPALKIKIAYARRGSPQERASKRSNPPNVVEVDISFNEPLSDIHVIKLTDGESLYVYGLIELMAEKYRAMFQQVSRDRIRRQDVYDLNFLIKAHPYLDEDFKVRLLEVFQVKCRSRGIDPEIKLIDDPEVRNRSGADWGTFA
ncbi:nucleotidyl transferase AbiEii/AbiGii toxin family protein [Nisaea sp.]|uniref:nucleotidyl transferase AbiEii/AbiGii toxin family protein n=1 Tax=Nisaea sp. TaxID=2024842 RepID=UPI0032F00AC9